MTIHHRRRGAAEGPDEIPKRVLAQYRRLIDRIPDNQVAFLQFSPKEDMDLGRRALLQVAAISRKFIKFSAVPGRPLWLRLECCSKYQWEKWLIVEGNRSTLDPGLPVDPKRMVTVDPTQTPEERAVEPSSCVFRYYPIDPRGRRQSARAAAAVRSERDSLIYATENSLNDFGDTVSEDDKKNITTAITELKQRADRNDTATIKDSRQSAETLPTVKERPDTTREAAMSRGARKHGDDLESALQECRQAAQDGSKIAQESLRSTKAAVDRVTIELLQSAREVRLLEHEIFERFQRFGSDLDARQGESRKRLEEARRGMDDFSIALFGRTNAGKSTLMEILTDGDGASIGKGAQRTTRHVRTYRWRGLKVTDVPGISAFEGAEDERSAFDAAKSADLVLFLITDDAPQPGEAECFARVRALGKPLIGICNVKKALEDDDDLRLFLHSPERCFDMNRLKALERQFHELAAKHNAGPRVFFVFTHLLARFVARRPGHRHRGKDLQRASRFSRVEQRILDMIVRHGTFLRMKRFIDLAGNPSGQMSNELLDFSARNADDGRVVLGSKREIDTWFSTSCNDWNDRIEAFVGTIADDLRAEIPGFVEDHYQDPAVSLAWKSVVTRHNVKRTEQRFQEELYEECRAKLAEHSRQLEREMQLVGDFAHDLRISLNPISDSKRAWDWTTIAVSGLFGLGALLVPVLGWVAAGVGLLGRLLGGLFEDREEKASRQREKLSKTLHADVERHDRELRSNLYGWLNKSVVEPVEAHVRGLQTAANSKFILANAQRTLAWTLNRERKKLHRLLLCKALHQLGDGQHINLIRDIGRVPGTAMMLVVDPGTRFPDPIRRALQDILTEEIWFVVNTNQKSIVRQALRLECDFREINIEERIRVARVPIAELDASGLARVDLTQQLTELHVMKSVLGKGRL